MTVNYISVTQLTVWSCYHTLIVLLVSKIHSLLQTCSNNVHIDVHRSSACTDTHCKTCTLALILGQAVLNWQCALDMCRFSLLLSIQMTQTQRKHQTWDFIRAQCGDIVASERNMYVVILYLKTLAIIKNQSILKKQALLLVCVIPCLRFKSLPTSPCGESSVRVSFTY